MTELVKKKTDTLKRLENIFFWLGVVSTIFLVGLFSGRWLINQQPQTTKPQRLNEREIEQYELQREHLISLNSLVNSPAIHAFFTDLLTTYAKRFADSQSLDISRLPLVFGEFYWDQKSGQGLGIMGHCFPSQVIYPCQEITIELNRLYLLNKLGHDHYFTSYPQYGEYTYIDISFDKMIDTCSHEIAHYIQLAKHGKSSCESDLKLNNGKYDEELAKEQEEWMGEIYGMIEVEIGEWEKRWKEIK